MWLSLSRFFLHDLSRRRMPTISHFIDIILQKRMEAKSRSSSDPKWDWTLIHIEKDKEHKALKDIKIPPIWIITISFGFSKRKTTEKNFNVSSPAFSTSLKRVVAFFSIHCLLRDFALPISTRCYTKKLLFIIKQ